MRCYQPYVVVPGFEQSDLEYLSLTLAREDIHCREPGRGRVRFARVPNGNFHGT